MTDAQRTPDPRHRHAGGADACCADAHDTQVATIADSEPPVATTATDGAAAPALGKLRLSV